MDLPLLLRATTPPALVERAGPHPQKRARAHRGWQLPRPGDAAAGISALALKWNIRGYLNIEPVIQKNGKSAVMC
jgi:hypothetical protein